MALNAGTARSASASNPKGVPWDRWKGKEMSAYVRICPQKQKISLLYVCPGFNPSVDGGLPWPRRLALTPLVVS